MTVPPRKATIHDIARLSGASPSTVSAALSENWKSRRISEPRVEEIRRIAAEQGYSINMQARGLRQARSGLVGMVIPIHDNRFFSSMSQSFEAFARDRGLVPVIASSMRDRNEELRIVRTLISYAVDYLFIAGATDPEAITALCRTAGLRHVFVDLPGPGAPSVISDNHQGAARLTRQLLADMTGDPTPRGRIYLIGGVATDYATSRRIEGFRDVLAEAGHPPAPEQIIACGYSPLRAKHEITALCDRLGGLPAGLFVNSLTAFEGVLGYLVGLPPEAVEGTAIGCYDYDPFAAYLQFPVHMVRQDSHRLIELAYDLIDREDQTPALYEVEPKLIPPRTIDYGPHGQFG
ncbi:LacI family DNA-binding transcriptional regulator [Rhodobacter sp. Har01]|uniref:LacI family DNA-binding transcriptional regulator n=1 Tax=Rhodobacter sp. Har01 TaxID=2883999 RepID=UPI001D08B087|nr:LacI family DNA-binding transcriptional regulator [Rhodobacter sp. Har01]MCB6179336.1 LacI family DNA-binding transcriptional regulator [Rhodobacter sp. Har01]